MISKLSFKNFKLFKEEQTLQLRPITILIGKNSSEKSSITKLPTLIEGALSGQFKAPIQLNNNDVELGAEFRDLIYGRSPVGLFEFSISDEKNNKLSTTLGNASSTKFEPQIFELNYKKSGQEIFSWVHKDNTISPIFRGIRPVSGEVDLKLKVDYIGPIRACLKISYCLIEYSIQHNCRIS